MIEKYISMRLRGILVKHISLNSKAGTNVMYCTYEIIRESNGYPRYKQRMAIDCYLLGLDQEFEKMSKDSIYSIFESIPTLFSKMPFQHISKLACQDL